MVIFTARSRAVLDEGKRFMRNHHFVFESRCSFFANFSAYCNYALWYTFFKLFESVGGSDFCRAPHVASFVINLNVVCGDVILCYGNCQFLAPRSGSRFTKSEVLCQWLCAFARPDWVCLSSPCWWQTQSTALRPTRQSSTANAISLSHDRQVIFKSVCSQKQQWLVTLRPMWNCDVQRVAAFGAACDLPGSKA